VLIASLFLPTTAILTDAPSTSPPTDARRAFPGNDKDSPNKRKGLVEDLRNKVR
jgi:hypothetical protein